MKISVLSSAKTTVTVHFHRYDAASGAEVAQPLSLTGTTRTQDEWDDLVAKNLTAPGEQHQRDAAFFASVFEDWDVQTDSGEAFPLTADNVTLLLRSTAGPQIREAFARGVAKLRFGTPVKNS